VGWHSSHVEHTLLEVEEAGEGIVGVVTRQEEG